jgi:hypothetical protein
MIVGIDLGTCVGRNSRPAIGRLWRPLFVVLMLVVTGLSPLRVGGVALLLGIVLTMLTCEWNEWAARRQAVRPAEARAGL